MAAATATPAHADHRPDALLAQELCDRAIRTRVELKLKQEEQENAVRMQDLALRSSIARGAEEREQESTRAAHQRALTAAAAQAELARQREAAEQALALEKAKDEVRDALFVCCPGTCAPPQVVTCHDWPNDVCARATALRRRRARVVRPRRSRRSSTWRASGSWAWSSRPRCWRPWSPSPTA